jgi:hypothetical protein
MNTNTKSSHAGPSGRAVCGERLDDDYTTEITGSNTYQGMVV